MYRSHSYQEFWRDHPKSSKILILHTSTLKKEVKCAFKMVTQLNSTKCQNPKTHSLTVSHYEILNQMKVCVCEVL